MESEASRLWKEHWRNIEVYHAVELYLAGYLHGFDVDGGESLGDYLEESVLNNPLGMVVMLQNERLLPSESAEEDARLQREAMRCLASAKKRLKVLGDALEIIKEV